MLIVPTNKANTENTKDHQSTSTTDERETVEPRIDIEAHQSAAGLHHRSSQVLNTSNTNTTATTLSTRSTQKSTMPTDNLILEH